MYLWLLHFQHTYARVTQRLAVPSTTPGAYLEIVRLLMMGLKTRSLLLTGSGHYGHAVGKATAQNRRTVGNSSAVLSPEPKSHASRPGPAQAHRLISAVFPYSMQHGKGYGVSLLLLWDPFYSVRSRYPQVQGCFSRCADYL